MQGSLSYLLQFGATMQELEELQEALRAEFTIFEEKDNRGSIFSSGEKQ